MEAAGAQSLCAYFSTHLTRRPSVPQVREVRILAGVFLDRRVQLNRRLHALPGDLEVSPAGFVAGEIVVEDARASDPLGRLEKDAGRFLALLQFVEGEGALDREFVFVREKRLPF